MQEEPTPRSTASGTPVPLPSLSSVLREHRFSFLPAWLLVPGYAATQGRFGDLGLSPNAAKGAWLALLVYALARLWTVVKDSRVATHHVLIAWWAGTALFGLLFLTLPTHSRAQRPAPAPAEGMPLPPVEPSSPGTEAGLESPPNPTPEPTAPPRNSRPVDFDPLASAAYSGPSQQLATRLHPTGDGVVAGVRWQGYFSRRLSSPEPSHEFRIRIFADQEGLPAESPLVDHILQVAGQPTAFTTGESAPPANRGIPFLEFEASLPSPARLDPAKAYWLSITTTRHGLWLWARAQSAEKPMVWFSSKAKTWTKSTGLPGSFAHSLQPARSLP